MNPRQLYVVTPEGEPKASGVYSCGQCRLVYMDEETATRCCTCSYCGKPLGDGETKRGLGIHHGECWTAHSKQWFTQRVEKAETVPYEAIPVEDAECLYVHEWDEYFFDEGSLEDKLSEVQWESQDEGISFQDCVPPFIFPCKRNVWPGLDIEDVLNNDTKNYLAEDDTFDMFVEGYDELKEAVGRFNAKNEGRVYCFEPDYSRKIPTESLGIKLLPDENDIASWVPTPGQRERQRAEQEGKAE